MTDGPRSPGPAANWFVGLPVPTEGWLDALLAEVPRRVRTFAPGDVHLTVAFFGRVSEEAARRGWAAADPTGHPPFRVRLGSLAPMGNPRRPSALSLLLDEGRDEAVRLIEALRDPVLAAAGARPDRRPPKPHVTVARPRRKASKPERREALAWAAAQPPVNAALTLEQLALYTWSDDRPATLFRIVDTRPLDGP